MHWEEKYYTLTKQREEAYRNSPIPTEFGIENYDESELVPPEESDEPSPPVRAVFSQDRFNRFVALAEDADLMAEDLCLDIVVDCPRNGNGTIELAGDYFLITGPCNPVARRTFNRLIAESAEFTISHLKDYFLITFLFELYDCITIVS